ncbi:MAG TPA: hypothetical protein VGS79_19705 [Puia sp.]|nr:hypothetical protein [Puia sp.]
MKPKRTIVQDIHLEDGQDDFDPPPFNTKPSFKNLEDWLVNVCHSQRPSKPISTYAFGVFESQHERVMLLVGMNKYDNYEKIEFQPPNKYFLLPQSDYEALNRDQLADKLTKQLRDFIATKEFQDSYMAEATSIFLSGKLVWTK